MLKILSKMVTGLVKEMGVRRVIEENETECNQVGVLATSPVFKAERQAMRMEKDVGIVVGRGTIESGDAPDLMRRMFVKLAKQVNLLLGKKEMSVNRKEKVLSPMPNQAVGGKERIRQLVQLPIDLLAEYKFALSLSSKKEVVWVNTS